MSATEESEHTVYLVKAIALPIIALLILALGIWLILYLNKLGRRDKEAARWGDAGAGADADAVGDSAVGGGGGGGVGTELTAFPKGGVGGNRRLGTTTTITAGRPPWA